MEKVYQPGNNETTNDTRRYATALVRKLILEIRRAKAISRTPGLSVDTNYTSQLAEWTLGRYEFIEEALKVIERPDNDHAAMASQLTRLTACIEGTKENYFRVHYESSDQIKFLLTSSLCGTASIRACEQQAEGKNISALFNIFIECVNFSGVVLKRGTPNESLCNQPDCCLCSLEMTLVTLNALVEERRDCQKTWETEKMLKKLSEDDAVYEISAPNVVDYFNYFSTSMQKCGRSAIWKHCVKHTKSKRSFLETILNLFRDCLQCSDKVFVDGFISAPGEKKRSCHRSCLVCTVRLVLADIKSICSYWSWS